MSPIFDSISNHPIMLDIVDCTGTEDTLLECSHSAIGNYLCGQFIKHEPLHVAIQCQGMHL